MSGGISYIANKYLEANNPNGKSDIVFWHIKLNSTAEKTHPRVTADQQT